MEFELYVFEEFNKFELKIAMYNRCPHFYGGILPISRRKLILCFVVKTSAVLAILFLVILPETSIAAAPKYETAYACEGKTLTIECEPGYFISLIRANYGRFSITICNDHGNVEWSVNCMFPKSLKVLSSKCAHKQNCSVFASTNIFGDPCPGTHKYLEAHYQCVSASQTSTTTNRPSPPWLITNQPNTWSTSTVRETITTSKKDIFNKPSSVGGGVVGGSGINDKDIHLVGGKSSSTIDHNDKSSSSSSSNSNSDNISYNNSGSGSNNNNNNNNNRNDTNTSSGSSNRSSSTSQPSSTSLGGRHVQSNRINDSSLETGLSGSSNGQSVSAVDDQQILRQSRLTTTSTPIGTGGVVGGNIGYGNTNNPTFTEQRRTERQKQQNISEDNSSNLNNNNNNNKNYELYTTQSSLLVNKNNNNNNNINNNNGLGGGITVGDGNNYYCGPTTARNLFWNITKAGEVNVQPCPGGATGIAKWRCILIRQPQYHNSHHHNYYFNQDNYYENMFNNNKMTTSDISDNNNDNDNNDNDNNGDSNENVNDNSNNNNDECDKNTNCNNSNKKMNSNNNISSSSSSLSQSKIIKNLDQSLTAWYPKTPDLTQCRSLWLNNLEIRVNQRDSSLISIANDLSQVTSSKTLYGGDMLVTTKIIQTMSDKMSYDIETFPDQKQREAIIYELLHGVVKTGSNLLDISQQVSWLDLSFEDQMRVATQLLTGIEDNAFLLADTITRERNVVQKVKNILLSIRVLETRNIAGNEIFPDAKIEQWHVSDDRIELPRGALIENSEGGLVRIVFVAFDRLESILKPSFSNLDLKFTTNYVQNSGVMNHSNPTKNMRILNSKVISASLGKGRHIQLSQPIRLILRHLKLENVTNPTCVFWNYIDHAWSEDGCYLEETNRTHTICMCNHLTNFAILMDIVDEHHSLLLSIFDNNMRILIYISIAICLIFIVIAILTLKIFNGIFIKSTQTSIYKNVYVCLFIIETLFLIGIEQSETSILCGFTTAFLHCFLLSAIAWLCFEGFQIYLTLTTDDMLLEVGNTSKIIWYYLLSYGLSLTIVAISLVIDPSTYTQSDFCVLMESNGVFYATFAVPIGFFALGAIANTFLSLYVMCKKNKTTLKSKEHTRLTNVKFDLQCFFIFLSIVSGDWIFSYIYLRKIKQDDATANTFGNLFVVFNSFLGIYIFVFHCIQNEKIRREYRKYMRQNTWLPKCLRCSKTSSISSSASHNQHNQHFNVALSGASGTVAGIDSACGGSDGNSNNKTPMLKSSPLRKDSTSDQSSVAGVPEAGSSTMTTHRIQIAGSLYPQQTSQQSDTNINTLITRAQGGHKLILERTPGGTLKPLNAGYTSPTSSAGSTHLIFNSMQNDQTQDWNCSQAEGYFVEGSSNDTAIQNLNIYDDKFMYYDCKSTGKRSKQKNSRNIFSSSNHDGFYWTGGKNRKNLNTELMKQKSPDKQQQQQQQQQAHSFYPSYKKSLRKRLATAIDNDKLSDSDLTEAETERRFLNYPPSQQLPPSSQMTPSSLKHYQSHQIMISNEDLADTNLIPPQPGGTRITPPLPGDQHHHFHQSQQQHHQLSYNHHHHPLQYRNKQSNSCDLPDEFSSSPSCRMSPGGGSYYHNQDSSGMHDEPVYEEILSNRASDNYDNNGDDDRCGRGGSGSVGVLIGVRGRSDNIDDYDDDEDAIMAAEEERFNRIRRMMVSGNKDDELRQTFNYNQQSFKGLSSSHRPNNLNIDHHHKQQYQSQDHPPPLPHFKQQQQQQQQPQQIVGRNLSAMLDENNTVVCYLEPLPK